MIPETAITYYKKLTELNGQTPSTGDVICYDGVIIDNEAKEGECRHYPSQSITISDCHGRVRLHRGRYDSDADWCRKVKKLHDAIGDYLNHLEINGKNGVNIH